MTCKTRERATFGAAFDRLAKWAACQSGRPSTFLLAVFIVASWGLSGPIFGYSDTWQLVINTGTTIVTFLMVFLIQSTQNRDTAALQVKIDELIRVTHGAKNMMLDLEELSEEELEEFRAKYQRLAEKSRGRRRTPKKQT